MPLSDILRRVSKLAADNSPLILSAVAVTGTMTTAYLTGKATVKAVKLIRDYEGPTSWESPLDVQEKAKLVWKLYLPPAICCASTIVCIILAQRIGTRRAAALAATYAITERAFEEYREKVVEKLGGKKETEIRDDVARDQIRRTTPPPAETIVLGGGSVLCYEAFTGRYFISSMEDLKKAQNDLNYRVNNDYYASLTDFYNMVGLPKTEASDEFGWNSDKLLELMFSTVLTEDGRPCLSMSYHVVPIRDFYRVQ